MASSTLCKYTTHVHVCTLSCMNLISVERKIKLEPVARMLQRNMQYAIKCSGLIEQMSVGVPTHQLYQLYVVLFVHVHIQNSGCV